MNFVTDNSITVVANISEGVATTYADLSTSLLVTKNNRTKRYNCTVVNATETTPGTITATGVETIDEALYLIKFVHESNSDLDTDGVSIDVIKTGSFRKIATTASVEI